MVILPQSVLMRAILLRPADAGPIDNLPTLVPVPIWQVLCSSPEMEPIIELPELIVIPPIFVTRRDIIYSKILIILS